MFVCVCVCLCVCVCVCVSVSVCEVIIRGIIKMLCCSVKEEVEFHVVDIHLCGTFHF